MSNALAIDSTAAWDAGWWLAAERRYSPNFNARPEGTTVDLVVLHHISLPPGVFGGDEVAAFAMAHAAEFHITYIIWRQRIWSPGGSWRPMADRGGATANHFDHVHISVTG